MASWVLVPCLGKLRSEFNKIAPERDTTSDGTIGDEAHQASMSDHNDDEVGNVPIHDVDKKHEVHALDVDVDLREPGLSMEEVVQFLLKRCRSGAESRLRYIIYNRRIWSESNGWRQKDYTGANAHDHHAHFSSSYETDEEASIASWHLEDLVALTTDDKNWISGEIAKQIKDNVDEIANGVFRRIRDDKSTTISDTGVNLIGAQITEAVIAGTPIARFPANVDK